MRTFLARKPRFLLTLVWVLALTVQARGEDGKSEPTSKSASSEFSWIFKGGMLVDGTGSPARRADVAIRGDRIVAVGDFPIPASNSAQVIDISGRIIAPGFIDLHSHSDQSITNSAKTRQNLNYIKQGVTTVITGNCGLGAHDVQAYFRSIHSGGVATNVIHLIPHGAIRQQILGNADKKADPQALERMKVLVDQGMKHGAWGLSTGLIYVPSRYGDTAELIELSKIVARHGGIYATHMRNEGERLLQSVEEAIQIGREAKLTVQISHLKAGGQAAWGLVRPACEKIAEARKQGLRIYADQYPYIASSTSLGAMVVPDWALQGTADDFRKILSNPDKAAKLRSEIAKELKGRDGGSRIKISRFAPHPQWVGLSLVEIADREKKEPIDIVLEIQSRGGAGAISFGMNEEDVRFVMAQDYVATASDGSAHVAGGGDKPHPRAYGTFPRKIRYALDDKILSLEQAIRSMSGLPAEVLGLSNRGVIREGTIADLVVFDPKVFRDSATFDQPTVFPKGLDYVMVNGAPAIFRGESRTKLAGRVLRPQTDGAARMIIQSKRIWTADPAQPWAEAVAIRDGAIIAVGSREDVQRFAGSQTQIIDHPDAFIMPGLIDAHAHITMLGESVEQVDLREAKNLDEVARLVKKRIDEVPGDSWILGRNWDQSLWPGMEFPTAAVLDKVAPNRPVWLRRVDGHAGWANSEAMKRAKVGKDSKAPDDGQIHHDSDGDPTGVFIDGAMDLIGRAVPGSSLADLERQTLAAQKLCLQAGLTSVHDASVSKGFAEVCRKLEKEGKLKLRVYGMASVPDGGEVAFASKPPVWTNPEARFQLRAIKLFSDGAMGSRGALMFEPYSDDPGNRGLTLVKPDVLKATTIEALKNGWQVCVHAIGDQANSVVLDAFEAARKAVPQAVDPRLRIEHAQVVRRQDVARFKAIGVIASMQPAHASTDKRWADARLGPERVKGAYAWRWFLDEGVEVAWGSDFPVEIENPFWGLYASITRQDEQAQPQGGWRPEQRMSIEEALQGFTRGAARAAFAENRVGVLKPGMRADLIVLDRDPFKVKPLELLKTRVLKTIIDGEVVH